MAGGHDGVDAAPDVEVSHHGHLPGLEEFHEVVQDAIGDIFVEVSLV